MTVPQVSCPSYFKPKIIVDIFRTQWCVTTKCHDADDVPDVTFVRSLFNRATPTSLTITMSLPPARRDISDHPSKGSVTDPVNKDQLHADVDRKVSVGGAVFC